MGLNLSLNLVLNRDDWYNRRGHDVPSYHQMLLDDRLSDINTERLKTTFGNFIYDENHKTLDINSAIIKKGYNPNRVTLFMEEYMDNGEYVSYFRCNDTYAQFLIEPSDCEIIMKIIPTILYKTIGWQRGGANKAFYKKIQPYHIVVDKLEITHHLVDYFHKSRKNFKMMMVDKFVNGQTFAEYGW